MFSDSNSSKILLQMRNGFWLAEMFLFICENLASANQNTLTISKNFRWSRMCCMPTRNFLQILNAFISKFPFFYFFQSTYLPFKKSILFRSIDHLVATSGWPTVQFLQNILLQSPAASVIPCEKIFQISSGWRVSECFHQEAIIFYICSIFNDFSISYSMKSIF